MAERCYHVTLMTALREFAREYWSNRPMELAAALSYYTLLSLAPLVLMVVAVAGLVFDRATVEGRMVTEMRLLVGAEGSEVVQTVLRHARDREKGALSVIIGTGFLLLVSLVVSAAVAAVGETALGGLTDAAVVLRGLNALVSLIVITLLFATIFKVLPDVPVAWRDVWVGASITAALFSVGKSLIGLYLGRASIGSPYGAAGSLVVMTVWVFYASLIVFFGAELTYIRSKR